MSQNTKIGIVTAAGYTEAEKYYGRLHGLLEAIKATTLLHPTQKQNIIIMGNCVSFPDFSVLHHSKK
jgi:IMP and pyridine-specific 5'-nucleotidase